MPSAPATDDTLMTQPPAALSASADARTIMNAPIALTPKMRWKVSASSTSQLAAPQVRVNAVCPGLITSRWFKDGLGEEGYQQVKAATEASTPLQRASSPEDIAQAICWLIEGAPTMTGELLMLDAGMHLGGRPQIPGRKP